MELHGIKVISVEEAPVLVCRGRIVNPFSKEFAMRVLPQIIAITEERRDVLDEIMNHFTFSSKEHYLRKCIMPIGNTEIPEVKETKLNVCMLCFNHCSKRHINEHLKSAHHIKNRFLHHTFATLGYTIPNQKRTMSYFYRKKLYSEKPIDMFDVGNTAARDNSEDKFLRYIHAEDYQGKGHAQYIASENERESGPVVAAVEAYMMKKRDHMRASHSIFSKMSAMGILKAKYIYSTRVLYAKLAGRFFYTFTKYSGNATIEEVILRSTPLLVERAVHVMMETYVLVARDPSEKFLQAVFISLMTADDTFAESRVRAKTLDAINYFLKLAASDYMLAKDNVNDVLLAWYETVYYDFEHYRSVHHKFNMTTPTFQTRVDEQDIRKAAIGAVNFSIDDLSKLARCLVKDYCRQAEALLPKGIISVDTLYGEFERNAVELINCKDRGYSVFFGTSAINDIAAKCLLRFRDALGDLWDDLEYMKIILQKLMKLNLNILVCVMITCGSPFRVSELYTLTFANPVGMTRSMYYSNGLIQLNIRYNKNTHSTLRYTNHTKVLPQDVSKIVIHYISVVRYLEIAIVERHGADEISRDISEPSYGINIDDNDDESDKEEAEALTSIAERQPRKAMLRTLVFLSPFGVRKGAQAFSFLERASERYIGERYTPRLLRQALVHFTRLLLTENRYGDTGFLKRIDKLAGHTTTTADMQYGVTHSNSLLPSVPVNNIDIRISLEWHRILGLTEKNGKAFHQKENRAVLKDIMSQCYIGRDEIDAIGNRLYNHFSIGTLDHAHMLHDACNSTRDMLIISPTGSGKSNAFKFPILAEKKLGLPFVSIIISPFVSLLEDMKEKLFDLQELAVAIYDPEKEYEYYVTCDVIIVQLEKAREAEGLVRYFHLEKVFKYIRRLVLDEAHILMEHKSFRAASIMKISEVFGSGVPKLFLSATFPKLYESRICRMFDIKDWRVHRGETIRKNIDHIVVQDTFDVTRALKKIYELEIKPMRTKGIVFVYKRSMAIELAQDLKWIVFHGNMLPGEKGNAYREFSRLEEGMIVATSAFSHGVDLKRISHVITVGQVNSIIEFQQVVGRMWRGEPERIGRSYILLLPGRMHEFIRPSSCVNGSLASELDGKEDENCSSLDCVSCSVCDETKRIDSGAFTHGSLESDEEMEVEVIEVEDSEDESSELQARLRDCQFNVLKLYGLRPESELVADSLGVYAKAFFSTVINPGLIVDLGVCSGCLLSSFHAHTLDSGHESLSSMQCSLTPLLHVFVIFFLCENRDGKAHLESMMMSPNLSSIMIRRIEVLIRDPGGKYESMARCLMNRSAIEKNHLEVSWAEVYRVNDYLENPCVDAAQLVYGPSDGWCELSRVTLNALEIACQFRFKSINGSKVFGFCFGCWGKLYHRRQVDCHKGLIARVLIYSYYEGSLLKRYCAERRIKLEYPSVCHLVDLMVFREGDNVPLFFDYVGWLLSRNQR